VRHDPGKHCSILRLWTCVQGVQRGCAKGNTPRCACTAGRARSPLGAPARAPTCLDRSRRSTQHLLPRARRRPRSCCDQSRDQDRRGRPQVRALLARGYPTTEQGPRQCPLPVRQPRADEDELGLGSCAHLTNLFASACHHPGPVAALRLGRVPARRENGAESDLRGLRGTLLGSFSEEDGTDVPTSWATPRENQMLHRPDGESGSQIRDLP
jgi:hypothetical protein